MLTRQNFYQQRLKMQHQRLGTCRLLHNDKLCERLTTWVRNSDTH